MKSLPTGTASPRCGTCALTMLKGDPDGKADRRICIPTRPVGGTTPDDIMWLPTARPLVVGERPPKIIVAGRTGNWVIDSVDDDDDPIYGDLGEGRRCRWQGRRTGPGTTMLEGDDSEECS